MLWTVYGLILPLRSKISLIVGIALFFTLLVRMNMTGDGLKVQESR